MDFERQNKLPEGVGKRIIEALKTNTEREFGDSSAYELQNNYADTSSFSHSQEPEYKDYTYSYEPKTQNYSSFTEEYAKPVEYREQKISNKELSDSSNIDTLVELVTKLPPGVTKQTGAQIIRHTMEAMGIPMNHVLSKAQLVQEELEQGIRNNVNTIEEHRSKIKTLDHEIQQFRKKAHDLEDIISLFILSENKK